MECDIANVHFTANFTEIILKIGQYFLKLRNVVALPVRFYAPPHPR